VNYKKGAAASDKVYQLLAHGRWFSPGTPASSKAKTGRHDIAEILLKMALSTINQIKSNNDKNIARPSKTSVCITTVMINTITTLSVLFSRFRLRPVFCGPKDASGPGLDILARLSLLVFCNLYFHCNFNPPLLFECSCSTVLVVTRINKNP
jgi:hypothetical protein